MSSNGTHAGLVQFATTARLEVQLEGDEKDILSKIGLMTEMGSKTAIAQGGLSLL